MGVCYLFLRTHFKTSSNPTATPMIVPLVPCLAIFFNLCLATLKTHFGLWISFTFFQALGLSIYFLYGIHHSKLQSRVDRHLSRK